jgi:hypothetical protein
MAHSVTLLARRRKKGYKDDRVSRWILAAACAYVAAVYVPDAGHGFIKDDVAWIEHGRVDSAADLQRVLLRAQGFYRPAVSVSFAIDWRTHGLRPAGYGATNLLLLGAGALALGYLATGLGLPRRAAVIAAFVWMLNFHGINMAVLWISGRTSLLLCVFALLAAALFVRGRALAAGGLTLLALFAKEEAVSLPLFLAVWAWLEGRGTGRDTSGEAQASRARFAASDEPGSQVHDARPSVRLVPVLRRVWPAWAALIVYSALRLGSGAHVPGSAPSFYQFTFDPAHVVENVLHYSDRALTYAALAVLVASLAVWRLPRLTPTSRRVFLFGALWMLSGYAITMLLPVRSSLYACFPSAGAALVAGALLADLWTATTRAGRRRLVAAALVLLAASYPVYRARNVRWVEIADLSAELFRAAGSLAAGGQTLPHVIVVDDRTTRRSFAAAFGTLLPTAVSLATGTRVPVWIEPPLEEGTAGFTPPSGPTARIVLRNGRVHVERP